MCLFSRAQQGLLAVLDVLTSMFGQSGGDLQAGEVHRFGITLDDESWFAKIEREVIARGVFTSVADLRRKLMKYIRAYTQRAQPIRWTYTDPKRRIATKRMTRTAH